MPRLTKKPIRTRKPRKHTPEELKTLDRMCDAEMVIRVLVSGITKTLSSEFISDQEIRSLHPMWEYLQLAIKEKEKLHEQLPRLK
jgi:hypothetical protein